MTGTNTSDKIIKFLEKKGVKYAFTVCGGHSMHLNDALFRSKIKPIFCHHEQAAAMAAEGYARMAGLGVCMLTAGPGVANAINGVIGAWADSSPLFVISGTNQSNEVTYMRKHKMRQVGLQGIDTELLVKGFTKYFHTLMKGDDLKEILDFAYKQATTDRKGPVWIEVPLDIQNLS